MREDESLRATLERLEGNLGCDVHSVILVRNVVTEEYQHWSAVAIPDRDRCYPLFGALADVRRDSPKGPIVEPRGLPAHIPSYNYEQFLSQEHTQSWFTLGEAQAYDAEWLKDEDGDWPWRQWQRWLKTMQFFYELYECKSTDDVVVVFDFDS